MSASPSLSFTLHDSAKNPHADIWFAEPPGFTAIPMDALLAPQDAPATRELRAALAPLLDSAPDERCRQLLLGHVASAHPLLAALRDVGVAYCSIGLHRDDVDEAAEVPGRSGRGSGGGDGRPLLSLLTLTWRDIATAPPAVTAARAVVAPGGIPHGNVEFVGEVGDGVPCGPVTISESVRTPAPDSGLVQLQPLVPLLQVHAHLPHPDGRRLAVFTLSTTAVHRREAYRRLLRHVVELVSFENPLKDSLKGSPKGSPRGSGARAVVPGQPYPCP
ncbi:hypothetical protein ABZ953_05315 [Streptomyces sp. NPDC046465]|uniref:hypothetical protein n=1 Tax=Streptomyces sp. NPDC046465 TaxID=3155810 RepID=UPI0033F31E34